MIRTSVSALKPGMKISKQIFDCEGNLLLGRNMVLDAYLIRGLKAKGIESVFISDEATDDIIVKEKLSEAVRGATIKDLKKIVTSIEQIMHDVKRETFWSASDLIGSKKFTSVFGNNPAMKSVSESARSIVEELLCSEDVSIGLNSIKSHDNYLFEHAIDVAVFGITIGRKFGFPEKRLRELGMGCLFHDIGMTLLPKSMINKEGALTHSELEQIKLHTEIGYELTKDSAHIGVLPPHVAFQHHEYHDGEGYPRSLKGNPKIDFTQKPRTIHIYASICTVADVYDALVSDRPYRKALPTEKALALMIDMRGSQLHPGILDDFLSFAPPFPVGTTVKFIEGPIKEAIGVVCALSSKDIGRPVVRVLYGPGRKRVKPFEVHLDSHPEVKIESTVI